MMSRDKLRQIRSKAKTMNPGGWPYTGKPGPDHRELILSLVDSNLEALDELEGGKSTQEQRAELKERERQVGLALKDLRVELDGCMGGAEWLRKPLFMLDMIEEMLKAKGPKWHREWSWFQPRISEEFSNAEQG